MISLETKRWATRTFLSVAELSLIGWVIYLIFNHSSSVSKEMQNALSMLVGALVINYAKASSFFFSETTSEITGLAEKPPPKSA
jgi:hypothetical protein